MREYENIFFVSSAGHCNLDCRYCIINPVPKNQLSLKYPELSFLLQKNVKKKLFIFSGLGDFFASYRENERLLSLLLEADINIALDINGVFIHEYKNLSLQEREKITYINLTMHFNQLKEKVLLERWVGNTKKLIANPPKKLFINTIISPLFVDEWAELLQFYSKNIFDEFEFKLALVKDVINKFNNSAEKKLKNLVKKYSYLISETIDQDFTIPLKKREYVNCPAGQKYFRIWNNGLIQGCPNNNSLVNMGNLFDRNMIFNEFPTSCVTPNFCDCNILKDLNMLPIVSRP